MLGDGVFSISAYYNENHTKKKKKITCRLRIEQGWHEPIEVRNSYHDVLTKYLNFKL